MAIRLYDITANTWVSIPVYDILQADAPTDAENPMYPMDDAPVDGSWINVVCKENPTRRYPARMAFYRGKSHWFVKGFPEPDGHWGATPIRWSERAQQVMEQECLAFAQANLLAYIDEHIN